MERKDFIERIKIFSMSETEAEKYAESFTDEEIKSNGEKIIDELKEDYRFSLSCKHCFGY